MLLHFLLIALLLHQTTCSTIMCTEKGNCLLDDGAQVTCSGLPPKRGTHILKAQESADGSFLATSEISIEPRDQLLRPTVHPALATVREGFASAQPISVTSPTTATVNLGGTDGKLKLQTNFFSGQVRCARFAGAPFGLCCCPCPIFGRGCWARDCHGTCGKRA